MYGSADMKNENRTMYPGVSYMYGSVDMKTELSFQV